MHLFIGNKLYSSWSLRPWIMLVEMGVPFEETVIPLQQADTGSRILAANPAGKVPALVLDDGTRIWESLAILESLGDIDPDKAVWPKDRAARIHARCLANEMHAGFQPLRQACPMNLSKRFAFKGYGADVRANVERIETLWREARKQFGARAGGPFLYGAFGAADAMYAPVVTRLDTYSWPVAADTRAYMDAVLTSASFTRWRDDALREPVAWDIAGYETGHTPIETFARG
jgi:glutathione S-transferase